MGELDWLVTNPQYKTAVDGINYCINLLAGTNDPLVRFFFLVIGMAAFGALVYHFYTKVSKRDIVSISLTKFADNSERATAVDITAYVAKYIIIFPLYTLTWAVIIAIVLLALAKQPDVGGAMLISTVIVGAARLLAYVDEFASQEISKLLPLVFLSVILLGFSDSAVSAAPKNIDVFVRAIPSAQPYFIGIVVLEVALRVLYTAKCWLFGRKSKAHGSMDDELAEALKRKKQK